jgi:hypothetical protein
MTSLLQKNIVLYLFIVFLIAGFTGCKPKISPKGHIFLKKISSDISALAKNVEHTIHTGNTSNAVEVICEWAKNTSIPTNQYLAIGLLNSSGTDFFSYDLSTGKGLISGDEKGDYSNYKAMQPLLKGHKFSTGTVFWEGMPYGVVCRVIEAGETNCGVVVLFLSIDTIKDSGITVDQFENNVL